MALSVRPVGPEQNEEMLRILLDAPMESEGLTLVLDRTPDIFTVPRHFFEAYKAYGFYMDDAMVGFGMICEKELYVNGQPRKTGYFANLYVKREARKMGWLYRASAPFFDDITQRVSIGYATTVKGNRATETMIGRRIPKFPLMPYTFSAGLHRTHNILITFAKKQRSKLHIRRAGDADLHAIAALLDSEYCNRLFGPVYTPEKLEQTIRSRPGFSISDYWVAENGERMVGVCSAWDIGSFRRIRVLAYRKSYRIIYRLYRLLGPLLGFPALPKPGEPFRELVVNDFATENRDPEILRALLVAVYGEARRRGYNMIQVGSYEGDPMLGAARRFFCQPLISNVVVGTTTEDLTEKEGIDLMRPFVDIALT